MTDAASRSSLSTTTGRLDEDTAHGLGALAEIVALDPFRPVVVCSAHGGNKELRAKCTA